MGARCRSGAVRYVVRLDHHAAWGFVSGLLSQACRGAAWLITAIATYAHVNERNEWH